MKVNISIDDVSPHPKSSINVIRNCEKIIDAHPNVKFTLFIPIAYWRTVRQDVKTQHPLAIDAYPDFCDSLKKLPRKNYEICLHGLFHGIPGVNDNDEFNNLSYEEATSKFQMIYRIITNAGMINVFKPVFRPPAWRMSSEAIRAAKDFGIKILALSPKDYAKQTYRGEDEKFKDVVYYNCNPPFDPLTHHETNEIVYHACEWDKNYFSTYMKDQLMQWINGINGVQFSFMTEMF